MKPLTSEEKVQITADMSDAITRICLEGIKASNPGFSERERHISYCVREADRGEDS